MNILIIGGTRFIGKHIALKLFAAGHRVTLLHRNKSISSDLAQFEHILLDRRNFGEFRIEEAFDLVIDTCAYTPSDLEILSSISFSQYLLISTVGVYCSSIPDNSNEDAKRLSDTDEESLRNQYGFQKRQTEDWVTSVKSDSIILRPSIVLGPAENSGRLSRILQKFARNNVLNAPLSDTNSLITQFIDVRDLAQLTLNIIESNKNGPFNIVGRSFKWNEFISIFASVGALDVVNSTDESFPLFDSTKSTGLRTLRSRHDFINNHEFISLEKTLIDWFHDIQY